ncbi:helix-turn-helix domain-containing protein [Sphingomonas mollis]|uniref:Helix-turn-helix transcriptional regulator n=1 Tax=Sphingomonas mollis TaxID=2795726 RepID=A0ABS0XT45_9SPHN|nr:helix-turn-helix transcriptional regulator [Sphingomonas sp. BT553]MBJ6123206.1 helix-turn-helix transcriptional regulator [Sphingomonas sp. BT553]
MDDRLAGLSPRQLQCLRLVARGLEAKEIGRSLGISDLTVKNHLSAARAALGVARSIDAARLVDAYDRALGDDPDATGASGTSAPPGIPDLSYYDVQPAGQSETSDDIDGLRDGGVIPYRTGPSLPLPFPTRRGQRNDLGIAPRLAIVGGLVVLLIAAVGFFVEASRGLKF